MITGHMATRRSCDQQTCHQAVSLPPQSTEEMMNTHLHFQIFWTALNDILATTECRARIKAILFSSLFGLALDKRIMNNLHDVKSLVHIFSRSFGLF